MLKSYARNLLRHEKIQGKIKSILNIEGLTREDIYQSLLNGNGWIFSQTKSGTTEFCHVLAFYRAIKHEVSNYDFESLPDFGVVRSAHNKFHDIGRAIRYASTYGGTVFFQTHEFAEVYPKIAILQTRNVFDHAVSAYFFKFKNKINKSDIAVDDVLDIIVSRYIDTYLLQRKAASNAELAIALHYEDTRKDPFVTLSKVMEQLDTSFDPRALQLAIKAAAPEKLKYYEKKQGHAVVAPKGSYSKPHFIRSGEVGEGRRFFSDKQIQLIEEKCSKKGVDPDGRLQF